MPIPPRERIRAAALELFTQKGYAGAATREICQRARVTKPVLYYHFGNKEQLYRTILLDTCHEVFDELTRIADGPGSPKQKLVDILATNFARTRKNPEFAILPFRMMFSATREGPRIDYEELGMRWIKVLSGVIREGIQKGEFRGHPERIAFALLGILVIYTLSFGLRSKPTLNRRLAREIVELVCQGCSNPKKKSPSTGAL